MSLKNSKQMYSIINNLLKRFHNSDSKYAKNFFIIPFRSKVTQAFFEIQEPRLDFFRVKNNYCGSFHGNEASNRYL